MPIFHSWIANRYFCLALEAILTLLIVVLAFTAPNVGCRWFALAEHFLTQAARRPRRAILLVMLLAIGGRAVLLPLIHIPEPWMQDEFSYLLAGETYALGRVTNQPHPMWCHFESVHILQQPTYMSMYPPAQGLFLAMGEKVAGQPWVGVWTSVVLMSGAICWMLQAWLPAPWALVGGLLVVARWGLFSYWINSYWGGAVPALGGALVAGSLPRLLRWRRIRDSFFLGLGLALLANSRPYEGLIFAASAGIAFLAWAAKRNPLRRIARPGPIIALGLVLSVTAAAMLYYNHRVTGAALELPYVADREQYAIAPLFLWKDLKPEPAYRTASLRRVYEGEVKLYKRGRSAAGFPEMLRKLKDFWIFYVGPLLTVPIAAFCLHSSPLENERKRLCLLILGVMLGALLLEVWFYPHYASPAMAVMIALILLGMRELRSWHWSGRPTGLFLVRAIPTTCLLLGFVPITALWLDLRPDYWPLQWYTGSPGIVQPPTLTAQLTAQHQKALVFVRYSPTHDLSEEWVYNKPEIDMEPVVWAREVDAVHDAALIRYFSKRSVWVFEPDKHPWKLQPYTSDLESQRSRSDSFR